MQQGERQKIASAKQLLEESMAHELDVKLCGKQAEQLKKDLKSKDGTARRVSVKLSTTSKLGLEI